jgi:hypothetical protein
MGWFSSLAAKVCSAVKRVKDAVVDTGKKLADGCAKVYSKFTGKEKFEQAKKLYDELRIKMDRAKQNYKAFVEKTTSEIDTEVNYINEAKRSLNNEHFTRFLRIASRIASWEIIIKELPDRFQYESLQADDIKARDELFLIDFDKNPVKSNLKALVSLGFWSRKKATETLHKVQEQEKVFELESRKLETEKTRLTAVLASLKNVSIYFRDLTKVYEGVLDELEYTVAMVANATQLVNPTFKGRKVDCYLFPNEHLLCLMAADKMTRILFEMTTLRYVSQEGELIEGDKGELKAKVDSFREITEQLAA